LLACGKQALLFKSKGNNNKKKKIRVASQKSLLALRKQAVCAKQG
jgi:hypothetical protein